MPECQPSPAVSAPPLRVAGHFGELMQGRLGTDGPVALISLPCPVLWVEVSARAAARFLIDADRVAAQCAVLCAALKCPVPAHLPTLDATMPLGGGAGSSTAGLVAMARWLGFDGTPAELARLCAGIEGASDPLMFPRAERLLFAPRTGAVLRQLPALPRFEVLGGFYGPVQRTDPKDMQFPDMQDLVDQWRPGMDVATMARLASTSARRSLALRGPANDRTEGLAQELGAAGWLIAHTGNARGLIFAPGKVPAGAREILLKAGFTAIIQFKGGGYA